ncbi:MAG: chromosome segregation protein SMC, partial [Clostridia bacterium]|nr:chromosome segregation protein SMC [Clostridia bacterium]
QKQVDALSENSKSSYEELKSKREQYNQEMTAIKVQIASSSEKVKALETEIARYELELKENQEQIDKCSAEVEKQSIVFNTALEMQRQTTEDEDTISMNKELENLNMKLSSFDKFKETILVEIKEIDEKKAKLNEDIARLQNKIFQEDTKLQKVDIDIENMQERIYEEYQMTINDCVPFKKDDFDIKEGMIAISRTKGLITGLVAVNVHDIEEYQSEGARYEEMSSQVEDLKKAEDDLIKVIGDLSSEMLAKFNEGFDRINENFQKVFKELFGGGNARLQILPSEDPLEAGIEIQAQPTGKAITSISLLSGGEKTMTAIAILFAILKLRPMPFCFLDEIEAALDDANIERYAKYLQRFSMETQFIVITHRKPTMELADGLFGVTMEEKGVSKIVSVRLSEAVKVVDDQEKE